MNKRQKETQQVFLDNEKAVLKKLEANYKDALDEINSKIEILMARQDADMQHVIYQIQYQQALKTQVKAILETLQTNEFETISEYLAKSYEDGFVGTMYDLQGQGIPLIFPIDQAQVVDAIQHETKLSEPLYTALGKDVKDLQKKISGEISRGISGGQMYSEITRNIAAWAMIPKNNAMRIARTEAHRIQTKATMDAQYKAKDKGADVVKQWDASLDKRTRDSHVQVDGEICELDEKFSNGLLYPGDPNGSAAEVINCRCALLQRARWALGNDYTKWSPDVPVVIDDDGTTQFVYVEADSYKEFKGYYKDITGQMTMNFQSGDSNRVRQSVQKINGEKTLGKNRESGYNDYVLNDSTDKWAKEAKEELLAFESVISARNKETAVVYDDSGNVLFRKYGGKSEVKFSVIEFLKLKGKVVTHNHPSGGSFSVGDINLLRTSKASEIRVATESGSYYLRYPEKWNSAINSKAKIKKERDIIAQEVKSKYQQMYLNGEINKVQRFQMASDETNRIFAERFGLDYGKEANRNQS